ncbi:hypothetical protein PHLCEN_2v5491 [Hermanssonia centrifuga]|uniref:Uncharacterized protein n=1 Tax=Hermanssonia centrifuga TaxID=98765 RepID=A0A2R6P294_9APHY|nr:hypothetical protein PHLCEN_2v5491 [Hermanssonia centrifuga]
MTRNVQPRVKRLNFRSVPTILFKLAEQQPQDMYRVCRSQGHGKPGVYDHASDSAESESENEDAATYQTMVK